MKANTIEVNTKKTLQIKKRKQLKITTLLFHLVVIIGSLIMVFPFLWSISSSLKDISQIFIVPPEFIPKPFVWSNYPDSLQAMPFGKAYWNSFYITVLIVTIQLFTASMAAYAFAKIKFKGSNFLFIFFLATMMIPKQVTMIPTYMIMEKIGWLDTHLSLIVPGALFNAFAVFLLRQFIMGIPKELEEAAIMDGANPPKVYWSVILPLIRPALAAVGIFIFMGSWNNFLEPLIYLSTPEYFTVPLLLDYFKGYYVTDWALMMAGSTISIIPVLIIYIIAQRHIIEGVALTGIKG
ncbi:carbohydrate ABC transporter permease [Lederbergia galactosidilytica]|uniref:Sugar ABC transporter permease n=1 Tax=Lederbergia galactosidilytica TaxID=217031 RepID=A0A177ZY61_9BACI|nr:carbohydrate ABC transporter permease [Lederbergia galactosidilytica]KRG12448.1 sugar ABC transporter permease [Virgibacillus soli]MBP1916643.1 multiple sugar transport system permease protein [Lederbergia galactosidilytica]OAK72250.1 sugar ABC transporter permease [Lederbergia galactosidilytica]